jgi:hypothetical protein
MTEIAADSAVAAPAGPSRWRVIRAAAAKEWTELRRDSRLVALFALVLLLLAGALAFGAAQHSRLDRERDAAAAADRALWVSQGAKNPHEAAHFGQFAFKPQSLLALAGTGDRRQAEFSARLDAFHASWRAFFASRIRAGAPLTLADHGALPLFSDARDDAVVAAEATPALSLGLGVPVLLFGVLALRGLRRCKAS